MILRAILFALGLYNVNSFGAEVYPVLATVEGVDPVTLIEGTDKRQVQVGAQVRFGERIVTGPKSAITLLYPDGSLLAIGPNTDLEVQARSPQTQWNNLRKGQVRGLIEKAPDPSKAAKPKFVIRTKTAVLGVRGTDFVMAFDALKAVTQVHTLEGSVDVGTSENTLMSGKGVAVERGQFIESSGKTIQPPKSFDRAEFLEKLRAEQLPSVEISSLSGPSAGSAGAAQALSLGGLPVSGVPLLGSSSREESDSKNKRDEKNLPVEERVKKDEKEPLTKLLAFQTGMFFTRTPELGVVRAVTLSWNPTYRLPILSFLSIRGHVGADFAQNGSLFRKFYVQEFQGFVTASFFSKIFVEAGLGEQIWWHGGPDAALATINGGIYLGPQGYINRIFFGTSMLNSTPQIQEFKVGIGIKLF